MSVPTSAEGLPVGFRKYVVGFMFDGSENEAVLLIEKQKPAWQQGKLNGIGGKIEQGESPIYAMTREFCEETGIETKKDDWTLNFVLNGPDYVVYFFSARGTIAEFRKTTDEQPRICSTRHLPKNVIYNLTWMIPLVLDKSIQFPITFADGVPQNDSTGVNK